jgi:hypothetical protein
MKFWKFEYPGSEALINCSNSMSLPSKETIFPGLTNTFAHPLKSMKVGDGVVLATLVGDEAKFYALGIVRSTDGSPDGPVIQWTATQFTKFPDAQGGLKHWQTKTSFEISPEPAKRYGLKELVAYYVRGNDESETESRG